MIEVTQTETYVPDGTRGNCVAAAVCSLFEIHDIRRVEAYFDYRPPSSQKLFNFTKTFYPFLKCNIQDRCTNYRIAETDDDGDRWTCDYPEEPCEAPTEGYWIASIISPRIPALHAGPYRGSPGLHMVVMKGEELAWDPHPEADGTLTTVCERTWWSGL